MNRTKPTVFSKTADAGQARPKDDPSEAAVRKIGLLVELLRGNRIRVADYLAEHGRNERTLQRDLAQLRAIGRDAGFSISPIKNGEFRLTGFDRRPRDLADGVYA
jgi:predicted DNA-binding transcriptional regulator YafY